MSLFPLILLLAFGGSQQPGNASVEGIVLRAGTTDPIERADVTLTREGQSDRNVVSGADGKFSFNNIVPGTYRIRIQRDGFFGPASASIQEGLSGLVSLSTGIALGDRVVAPAVNEMIEVAPSQRRTGLTYFLTAGGILTGRVSGGARPIPGATVTALRMTFQSGQPTFLPVKSSQSDDRGNFRISWLEAGEYFVRADAKLPDGNARAYFPSATSPDLAERVRIDPAQELSAIDILVRDVSTVTLSGSIENINIAVLQPTNRRTSSLRLVPLDRDAIVDV
jgi:hypothetical protein